MSNLVEALQPRIERIAVSVSRAMRQGNAYGGGASWQDYDKYPNRLKGELYSANAIAWRLASGFAGYEHAVIYTENIRPTDLLDQDFGPESIVEADVQERFQERLEIAEGSTFDETVSHTFATTVTREDAYKQGLRALAEEAIGVNSGGAVSGNFRSQQEFTAEFNQKYGSQEQHSDTISRKLTIPGPWAGTYEFVRSRNKTQQRVTAHADYDFSIRFADEHQVKYNRDAFREFWGWQPPTRNLFDFGWASMAELLAVMRREAPSSFALYQAYMDHPEDAGSIAAIAAPPGAASFLMTFDDQIKQDVIIRKAA